MIFLDVLGGFVVIMFLVLGVKWWVEHVRYNDQKEEDHHNDNSSTTV